MTLTSLMRLSRRSWISRPGYRDDVSAYNRCDAEYARPLDPSSIELRAAHRLRVSPLAVAQRHDRVHPGLIADDAGNVALTRQVLGQDHVARADPRNRAVADLDLRRARE